MKETEAPENENSLKNRNNLQKSQERVVTEDGLHREEIHVKPTAAF